MTIASTSEGKVQGLEKDGVLQFRGIPFATARRFRAPEPVEPWNDVRDATVFAPIMPQNPSGLESMLGKKETDPTDEDSLALNIFTPALDDGARPVMLWIHGGAFTAGAGSIPWYSGSNLVTKGDVVVVTINYRLGAFGYLYLDDVLGAEFAGSGNNGTRDQAAAIRWVRDNIASFGGDPNNITLFGESAGGMSIATLLAVPGVPELVRSAIPQSGSGDAVKDRATAKTVTAAVLSELGIRAGNAEALLDLPVEELLAAQGAAEAQLLSIGALRLPFAPVIDNVVLPAHPRERVRDGAAANVNLLVGTTSDEYRLFGLMDRARGGVDDALLLERVGRVIRDDRAQEAIALYRTGRPNASSSDIWSDFATDWIFRIPATRLAEAQAEHQRNTYAYLFSYASTAFDGALGACHAIDVPFVFDNLERRGVDVLLGPITEETRALGSATVSSWLAMARTGSPQHDGVPDWPTYSVPRRPVMELGLTRRVLDDPGADERQFWESLPT